MPCSWLRRRCTASRPASLCGCLRHGDAAALPGLLPPLLGWICLHQGCTSVVLQNGRLERLTVCVGSNTAAVQDALTEYRVIYSCDQGYTWLELFPRTGRKHQLRVHFAEVLGTPIIGDYQMDDKRTRTGRLYPCHNQSMRKCSRKGSFPLGLLWAVEA